MLTRQQLVDGNGDRAQVDQSPDEEREVSRCDWGVVRRGDRAGVGVRSERPRRERHRERLKDRRHGDKDNADTIITGAGHGPHCACRRRVTLRMQ